ncbi:hypothetical protein ANTPLA_LOCUS3674 [Anthophora plagiata]
MGLGAGKCLGVVEIVNYTENGDREGHKESSLVIYDSSKSATVEERLQSTKKRGNSCSQQVTVPTGSATVSFGESFKGTSPFDLVSPKKGKNLVRRTGVSPFPRAIFLLVQQLIPLFYNVFKSSRGKKFEILFAGHFQGPLRVSWVTFQ